MTYSSRIIPSCKTGLTLLLLAVAGCATHAEKLWNFRDAYSLGDFDAAHAEIDLLIADEADLPMERVGRTNALDPAIDPGEGDIYLLLMEKAMACLATGEVEDAVELLRRARDELDDHMAHDASSFVVTSLTDDRAFDYAGADYEHITIRVMLAICDLLAGGSDAYAYSLQVGEKQEDILESPLGEDLGYRPRALYQRVAIGAYIQGIMLERGLAYSEAEKVYSRMLSYQDSDIGQAALERVTTGHYAAAGNGVVHLFYLAGQGPFLESGYSDVTDDAFRLAQIFATLITDAIAPLAQADVPVPVLIISNPTISPLRVEVDREGEHWTESIMDINRVSAQQLEANMPLIIARAVVRRAIKTAITTGVEKAGQNTGGDEGALLQIGAILANLISTSIERADTRIWSALPAQIQAARMELAEGTHELSFSGGLKTQVRVTAGRDSYVVIVRPNLARPGVVLVDPYSRGEDHEQPEASEKMPDSSGEE